MQHRERDRAREFLILERHRGGIAFDHGDIRAVHALLECGGELRINLDGGYAREALTQNVGGEPGTRTYFQHVLSEVNAFERPWQDALLETFFPQRGATVPAMKAIQWSIPLRNFKPVV